MADSLATLADLVRRPSVNPMGRDVSGPEYLEGRITDYLVQYSIDNGASWITALDGVSSTARATVSGLTNGRSYVFRVAAITAGGIGWFSANSAALTPRA
jgi:hypothetical protein